MTLTITIADPRVVDGLTEGANRNETTAEAIALEIVSRQGQMYADLYGVASMTSAAFMARFTPSEYAAIMQAAQANAEVKEQLNLLITNPIVNLYDPRVSAGLGKLVAAGLLAGERVPELMAYARPTPVEEPTP